MSFVYLMVKLFAMNGLEHDILSLKTSLISVYFMKLLKILRDLKVANERQLCKVFKKL